ncbi:MAG: NUDIX hydrolase [Chloroflexota bacterium]|nr:NUDIX hydrolase [Chloroflexota bacterium]
MAAVVRQGEQVLLVQQQGPHDPGPAWALPGGMLESGELLTEALAREVREETGLEIDQIGPLLYTVQLQNPTGQPTQIGEALEPGQSMTVFVFEVTEWRGDLRPDDPDEFIRDIGFFSIRDAVEKLEQHFWRVMREPVAAYLRGSADTGAVWQYRRQPGGAYQLVTRIGDWRDAPPVRPVPPRVESNPQQDRARAILVLGCLVLLLATVAVIVIGLITVFHHSM